LSRLGWQVKQRLRFILLIALAAVFVFSVTMLILYYAQGAKEGNALKQLAAIADKSTELPAPTSGSTPVATQTTETPVILEQYRALHEQNADMVGWIKIDGTVIDYPVMYTFDDFYLSHGFDKEESKSGVPFIDKRCTVEPFGTNTIIYGHHMKNGTMFAGLENYKDADYYKEHPAICFDTLYTHQEYEIIAVFESQIYKKSDTVFKHYNFLNAEGQTDFDECIANVKALSLYDTGVTASYGDELLTLVTCAYHTENGQFVVVAKKTG
jgi:sortase B